MTPRSLSLSSRTKTALTGSSLSRKASTMAATGVSGATPLKSLWTSPETFTLSMEAASIRTPFEAGTPPRRAASRSAASFKTPRTRPPESTTGILATPSVTRRATASPRVLSPVSLGPSVSIILAATITHLFQSKGLPGSHPELLYKAHWPVAHLRLSYALDAEVLLPVYEPVLFGEYLGEALNHELHEALELAQALFKVYDELVSSYLLSEGIGGGPAGDVIYPAAELQLLHPLDGLHGRCVVPGRLDLLSPLLYHLEGIPGVLLEKRPCLVIVAPYEGVYEVFLIMVLPSGKACEFLGGIEVVEVVPVLGNPIPHGAEEAGLGLGGVLHEGEPLKEPVQDVTGREPRGEHEERLSGVAPGYEQKPVGEPREPVAVRFSKEVDVRETELGYALLEGLEHRM